MLEFELAYLPERIQTHAHQRPAGQRNIPVNWPDVQASRHLEDKYEFSNCK